ncbi:MAG: DUF433 domain-containing protein [Alphaproteobacteria bacterium]|nr:DUF433 domain-containing protein [Alphaproteobacteria bacterium]MBL6938754.1 DUF433 domain-containing protein [Alphaproteobacteria bacterium]MBL7097889.1 DUF433 domain-containing protein [Alphaproteobacteria bacterium]
MKHERIEFNPDVMLGKPVIKGTRLTVEHVMHELAEGMTEMEILAAHPRLKAEDIAAARAFADDYMARTAAQ